MTTKAREQRDDQIAQPHTNEIGGGLLAAGSGGRRGRVICRSGDDRAAASGVGVGERRRERE